ncbi:response regulator transcription factor [Paenibacillus physcomitrellae]|uniref:DNA-binding response regulator n=1 Tax=Paenibacillus physcomitrellae TaxID=1619311 RepID=A0ABQ1GNJ7_9BACL|nr:response regulator transcription factor [Paenibacillus physcomitrellae]GGA46639.1 hypothetical protein GCM10010917_34930 [Paenibacillus physcomitrellae]
MNNTLNTYCKVLIVDDEMLVRQGIKHLFDWESEGFTIVGEASNGKEALEQISLLRPHIILMDIVMPVMDGEELARIIQIRYPDVKIVVLSSFSEFEFVRSTFQSGASDYILKPKLDAVELLGILKKASGTLPGLQNADQPDRSGRWLAAALDKLVSGYPFDNESIRGRVLSSFVRPSFALLSMERLGGQGQAERSSEELQHTAEAVLESMIRSGNLPLEFRPLSQEAGRSRWLWNADERFFGSAGLAADVLQQLVEGCELEGLPAAAALSAPFHDLEALHEAAEQIPALLEKRFFLPDERVFMAGERTAKPLASPAFDGEAFNQELNGQEFQAAFARLRDYLAAVPGRLDIGMYEFKSLMGHCVFNIILALLRFQYEARRLEDRKYEYFRSIHESLDIREASGWIEAFLGEAEDCVLQRTRSAGNQAVQRILEFIQEHYAEPLTLTEIAHHFHFNPSYLSNYFATHNSEGFSEYLNKVRIEQACRLLRQGDMPISDISSQVGYSEHSYFTKVFRKQKGLSPSQYRKQLMEGQL